MRGGEISEKVYLIHSKFASPSASEKSVFDSQTVDGCPKLFQIYKLFLDLPGGPSTDIFREFFFAHSVYQRLQKADTLLTLSLPIVSTTAKIRCYL